MHLPATNAYFVAASNSEPAVLTVYAPGAGKRGVGAGWVNDPGGGSGNFGFLITSAPGSSAPAGESAYVFRGSNGDDYVVRSTGWTGSMLSISHTAISFNGKCSVTVLDPSTGLVVTALSGSGYSCTVAANDGTPQGKADTYSIGVNTATGAVFHRAGTAKAELRLGGGGIVVQAT